MAAPARGALSVVEQWGLGPGSLLAAAGGGGPSLSTEYTSVAEEIQAKCWPRVQGGRLAGAERGVLRSPHMSRIWRWLTQASADSTAAATQHENRGRRLHRRPGGHADLA